MYLLILIKHHAMRYKKEWRYSSRYS